MENNFDTIVAISTPITYSAIGIIRISGEESLNIAKKIFKGKILPKALNYGHIIDNCGKIIDEVILLYFKNPKSYTGEDVIEIQTHGSPVIMNHIIELIIALGARPAQKGEFTKRAFLNHRLDLTQAEAVIDIIESKNIKSAQASLNNLSGVLKKKTDDIKNDLKEIYSRVVASIDFPEDVGEVDNDYIESICNDKIQIIDNLLNSAKGQNFIKEGISVALIGKPNVGKSSLFNALLNYNRAIVTPIEGTTRDSLKETVNIDGYMLNFIDTAGIRDENQADLVEKIGIKNSVSVAKEAQIVLFLVENSLSETDDKLLQITKEKPVIYVQTKADINNITIPNTIKISSVTGIGLDDLKQCILANIKNIIGTETDYTTNKRHQSCLCRAKEALINAVNTIHENSLADFIATDLKTAIIALDEISGEQLTDTILDDIFEHFCIGK